MKTNLVYALKSKRNVRIDIEEYQDYIANSKIQATYEYLIQFIAKIQLVFNHETNYQTTNISPGYMDYTYFSFFTPTMREKKLRFCLVLNHETIQFELWLMGLNAEIQEQYWNQFYSYKTKKSHKNMTKLSIYEVVIDDKPNFENPEKLIKTIVETATEKATEIEAILL